MSRLGCTADPEVGELTISQQANNHLQHFLVVVGIDRRATMRLSVVVGRWCNVQVVGRCAGGRLNRLKHRTSTRQLLVQQSFIYQLQAKHPKEQWLASRLISFHPATMFQCVAQHRCTQCWLGSAPSVQNQCHPRARPAQRR